jgi:hypothetical protein
MKIWDITLYGGLKKIARPKWTKVVSEGKANAKKRE